MKRLGVVSGRLMAELDSGQSIDLALGEPFASRFIQELAASSGAARLAMAVQALTAIVAIDTDYRVGYPAVRGGAASIAAASLRVIEKTPDESTLSVAKLMGTMCGEITGAECLCARRPGNVVRSNNCSQRERQAKAIMASIGRPVK